MLAAFETPLALRYWPVIAGKSEPMGSRSRRRRRFFGRSSPIGKRVLIFDTETTTDAFQSLRFGFWRVYSGGHVEQEGIFVADELPTEDGAAWELIREYAGRRELALLTREEFIRQVFFPEAWSAGTLVVGFNLPFDLSRLAVHAGACRGRDRDAFSFKLSGSLYHPRLRVRPVSAHAALIGFTRPKKSEWGSRRRFAGRFLDLHTLAYALSGSTHSLRSAGEAFGTRVVKEESQEHGGPLTTDYLDYARRDVAATYSLLLALWILYDELPFATYAPEREADPADTPMMALYSGASLAKACLRKIGITDFRERLDDVPPEYLGFAMAAYYGGRTECRVRRLSVPAALLDFTSEYPAVFTLLSLWPQVTAKRLRIVEEEPEATAALLREVGADPDYLFSPATWPRLAGFALAVPDGDFLPSRAPWGCGDGGDLSAVTLSVAPLHWDEPIWYALPDLAASAVLTRKVPKLLRAFRCIPEGRLRLSRLTLGGVTLDPKRPDFIARIVQERKRLETAGETAAAMGAKALANSGCYGIFLEFNRMQFPDKEERRRATLYSDASFEHTFAEKTEAPGTFANPLIGALVTAGGRLLLTLLQREVESRSGVFIWTATDAMAIVEGDGGSVAGLPPEVRSLTQAEVAEIQERFQSLCPFGDVVKQFLKREATGTAYAVSSNRYCLFARDGRVVVSAEGGEDDSTPGWLIIGGEKREEGSAPGRFSLHGMSGVIPPGGMTLKEFGRIVWEAVLTGTVPAEWQREPLRRQFPIRRPPTWRQAREMIGGAEYQRSVKPFNFLQTVSAPRSALGLRDGGSYYGPFTRDSKRALKSRWWDPRSGERVRVSVRPLDAAMGELQPGHVYCSTLAEFLEEFQYHPEVKMMPPDGSPEFQGAAGLLIPKPVQARGVYYIGKETSRVVHGAAASAPEEADTPVTIRRGAVLRPNLLADISRLSPYPIAALADALDISEQHARDVFAARRPPSRALALRIRRLAIEVPPSPPCGLQARHAAIADTADRINGGDMSQRMNPLDVQTLDTFKADVEAGKISRPRLRTQRAANEACRWANEKIGEPVYFVRRHSTVSTPYRLCVTEEYVVRRKAERDARRTEEQRVKAEERRTADERLLLLAPAVSRLACYPTGAVARAIGVSDTFWRRVRDGQARPGAARAEMILALSAALPNTSPSGYTALCSSLAEAAAKAGLASGGLE